MSGLLKKILYIEDDEDIAEIATMIMEDIGGFEVKHFVYGQDAIDILPSFAPQLVVIDVMMPKMDGPETLRLIKEMPEGKDLPIIFMTAKAQIHEQESYEQMGTVGLIVKPFDPIKLCENITNIWNKHLSSKA